jgi:ribonucleotide reductase beta subunit family protein with ferritin-like domain
MKTESNFYLPAAAQFYEKQPLSEREAFEAICPPMPSWLSAADMKARTLEWQKHFPNHDASAVRAAARIFPATSCVEFEAWQQVRTKSISPSMQASEPLFAPDRATIGARLPVENRSICESRKAVECLHWIADEIDLSRDGADMKNATPEEQHLVEHVLAFFSIADELVLEGLDGSLKKLLHTKDARAYLCAQENQEYTHSEAYSLQIQEVIPAERQDEVFRAVQEFPTVSRMADWVRWWTMAEHTAADLFAAMSFIEGVMFSGFFAALQYFKTENKFPGITSLNEFICRDEGVHTMFWCKLLRVGLEHRPDTLIVNRIAAVTTQLSSEFFSAAMPVDLPGINAVLLGQYVRSVASSVTEASGFLSQYDDENPFPFMDAMKLNSVAKNNFFEHRPTQYQNIKSLAFSVNALPIKY